MKKIFITGISLFLIYNYVIIKIASFAQAKDSEANIVNAQEYLYNFPNKKYVIVGSSMAKFIPNNNISDGFYNLSIVAGSIYTGLEIIKHEKSELPSVIFVETNLINTLYDSDFVDNLFVPFIKDIKSFFPSLQRKYKFILLVDNYIPDWLLVKLFGKIAIVSGLYSENPISLANKDNVIKEKKDFFKNETIHYNNHFIDEKDKKNMESNINKINDYIRYFTKKNIKIVLFEIPTDTAIHYGEKMNYKRDLLDSIIKDKNILFFKDADAKKYSKYIKDGVHLNSEGSQIYLDYLKKKLIENNVLL
ncbi:MAG: hypothetical protein KA792_07285 [Bacteroidales bacterium]|nr:hypothetical protein [Bacteroidales bacterium]